jgi:hypothetical protein
MTHDLISFIVGVLLGALAVFVYLHKHTTAAVAAATNLALAVDGAKADLTAAKSAAQKL